jgi:hypothetical protein
MSSFASVLVANANATPEKVVPCNFCQSMLLTTIGGASYKINANDQLSLAPSCALHFGRGARTLGILLRHVLDARLRTKLLMSVRTTIPWWLRRT